MQLVDVISRSSGCVGFDLTCACPGNFTRHGNHIRQPRSRFLPRTERSLVVWLRLPLPQQDVNHGRSASASIPVGIPCSLSLTKVFHGK
jgi:hypothetical protein